MYKLDEFEKVTASLRDKRSKEAAEPTIRLINMLEKKGIEDEQLKKMLDELLLGLQTYETADKKMKKAVTYKFHEIAQYVSKTHKLFQKGALSSLYMTMFLAVGVAIGAGLSTMNVAYMGIGLPIGLAIGLAIGGQQEKKAEAEERIY